MAEFLSAAWIAELDAAARAAGDLTLADGDLVIGQVVRGLPGGEVRYQVHLGPAGAHVTSDGDDDDADLTLVTDAVTARSLHGGRARAQDALTAGSLKVQGRPEVLAKRAELLARLDAAFAPVRGRTTFAEVTGSGRGALDGR
jgi:hypothetical protein